jgi:two-component system, cell cycle response regulator DivK
MESNVTTPTAENKLCRGSGQLILIVEDNEKNGRMMIDMLKAAGYRTQLAGDGLEGLRLASELRPEIIVTDLQMPNMDGLAMTRALKSQADTASIPVIAVTAHALQEHREEALAAGCCLFLTKPFRLRTFLGEVADAIQRTAK